MSSRNEKLDNVIDTSERVVEKGLGYLVGGALVTIAGAAVSTILPPVGVAVASYGTGMMIGGAAGATGGSVVAAGAAIKKAIDN